MALDKMKPRASSASPRCNRDATASLTEPYAVALFTSQIALRHAPSETMLGAAV